MRNRSGEDIRAAANALVVRQHRGRQPHRQPDGAALHQIAGFAVMSAGLDDDWVGTGETHDLARRESDVGIGHGSKFIPRDGGSSLVRRVMQPPLRTTLAHRRG